MGKASPVIKRSWKSGFFVKASPFQYWLKWKKKKKERKGKKRKERKKHHMGQTDNVLICV